MNRIIVFIILIIVVLFAALSMVFIVDPRYMVIVSGIGDTKPTLAGPGLHVKLPLQTVSRIDMRVRTFDTLNMDPYITFDKIELLVNPIVKYRVNEPLTLFIATKSDTQMLVVQLTSFVRDVLSAVFAKYALSDALAKQREIANEARDKLQKATTQLGIEVLDVALMRVDFPTAMVNTVYKRMIAVREQQANTERAQGAAEAEQIKSDAERQRHALFANAYREAQFIKGKGDAKAAAIAAQAFSRDPQFYQFYQSMQAYRESFKKNDVVIVDASSGFFRFMRSSSGHGQHHGRR